MAFYIVTGRLGGGKTLASIWRIQQYLRQGRKVAANIDLNLDELVTKRITQKEIIRLPDRPTLQDLEALGEGYHEYNEEKFGLIVLEEAALWLNTRNFQDKERKKIIDYLVNIRKKRWDVIIIIQHENALDKQVREMFGEFVVNCQRLDRLRIPLVGYLLEILGFSGRFGKMHICKVRYGLNPQSPKVDSWNFFGKSLYNCYNTMQEYNPDDTEIRSYCVLHPRYFTTGARSEFEVLWDKIKGASRHFRWSARYFFLAGLASGAFAFSGKPETVEVSQAKQEPAEKIQDSKPDLDKADHYRISGSIMFDNRSELFFEKNGVPWVPSYEGYKVLVRHSCEAHLLRNGEKLKVYCGEPAHAEAGAGLPQETVSTRDGLQPMINKITDSANNAVSGTAGNEHQAAQQSEHRLD
jgi:hypothetical protein